MKISCVIVEDEPLALERARDFVLKLPFLNLAGTFQNGPDALAFLRSNAVELIFLDITMGGLSGIELLETGVSRAQVIITTAYPEYALKGFELSVADYLLKPYTFERFLQAVEKVKLKLEKDLRPVKDFMFVKTEYRLEKVGLNELLYIEGMGDYRRIHAIGKKIMTLQTFRDLEKELPSNLVCRVHKSFMVSLSKIESIEKDQIKIKDVLIPVSETYKKAFYAHIQGH